MLLLLTFNSSFHPLVDHCATVARKLAEQ